MSKSLPASSNHTLIPPVPSQCGQGECPPGEGGAWFWAGVGAVGRGLLGRVLQRPSSCVIGPWLWRSILETLFPAQRALFSEGPTRDRAHSSTHDIFRFTSAHPLAFLAHSVPSTAPPLPPAHWNAMAHQRRSAAVTAAILQSRGRRGRAAKLAEGPRRTRAPAPPPGTCPRPHPGEIQHSTLHCHLHYLSPSPPAQSLTWLLVTHGEVTLTRSSPPASCLQVPAEKGERRSPHGDLGTQW